MQTENALLVLWIGTMIALGMAVQRGTWWKHSKEFDHELALTILGLVATMQPTRRTFHALEEIDNRNRFPFTMELVKGPVEAASGAAKLESLTDQDRPRAQPAENVR